MALQRWFDRAARQSESNGGGAVAGAPHAWRLNVTRDEWREAAEQMAAHGGRLLSLWASRDGRGDDRILFGAVEGNGFSMLVNFDHTSAKPLFYEHPFAIDRSLVRRSRDCAVVFARHGRSAEYG